MLRRSAAFVLGAACAGIGPAAAQEGDVPAVIVNSEGVPDSDGLSPNQRRAIREAGLDRFAVPRRLPAGFKLARISITKREAPPAACAVFVYLKSGAMTGVANTFALAVGDASLQPCREPETYVYRRYYYRQDGSQGYTYYYIVDSRQFNTVWIRSKSFGEVPLRLVERGCYEAVAKITDGPTVIFRDLCLSIMTRVDMRRLIESAEIKQP